MSANVAACSSVLFSQFSFFSDHGKAGKCTPYISFCTPCIQERKTVRELLGQGKPILN